MNNHKKICIKINGEQAVKLEKGTTEFKNHFKQIPVLFKVYADFECILDSVESYEGSSKKISRSNSLQFSYKLVCVVDRFSKPIIICRGQNAAYKFFEEILKELITEKK